MYELMVVSMQGWVLPGPFHLPINPFDVVIGMYRMLWSLWINYHFHPLLLPAMWIMLQYRKSWLSALSGQSWGEFLISSRNRLPYLTVIDFLLCCLLHTHRKLWGPSSHRQRGRVLQLSPIQPGRTWGHWRMYGKNLAWLYWLVDGSCIIVLWTFNIVGFMGYQLLHDLVVRCCVHNMFLCVGTPRI